MIDPHSFILGAVYATGFAFVSGCLFLYIYRKKKRRRKFRYDGIHGTGMPHIRGNIMYPSIRQPPPLWFPIDPLDKAIQGQYGGDPLPPADPKDLEEKN